MKLHNSRRLSRKTLWTILVLLLLALVLGFIYRDSLPIIGKDAPVPTKEPGQPAVTDSTDNGTSQGSAVDQNGQTDTPPPTTAKPVVSPSGAITVEQPTTGAKLKSGDTLSGTATVEVVQFRLTDNVRGVIAQGSLTVVNGKFSGLLKFTPKGTTGHLDVFSYDPASGAEINEARVAVAY